MAELTLAAKESDQIELTGVQGQNSLYKGLLQVPELVERRHELVYEQKSRLLGRHYRITLFNGRYLEWAEKKGRREITRIVNLAFVEASSRPHRDIAWRSLIVALLAVTVAGLLWVVGDRLMALAALMVSVIAAGFFVRASTRRLLFYTRNGRVLVFDLFDQRRSSERFGKVVAALQLRGDKAWALLSDKKEKLAAEVAEHRRLMEEGVISQAQYEGAKQKIFRCYSD